MTVTYTQFIIGSLFLKEQHNNLATMIYRLYPPPKQLHDAMATNSGQCQL